VPLWQRAPPASWDAFSKALPASRGILFFSIQHWWDGFGVVYPVLVSSVQEKHGHTAVSSAKGNEDN